MNAHPRFGLTLTEVVASIACIGACLAITTLATQDADDQALINRSLSNLRQLGVAHATYAAEWNGRQLTTCPDDLTLVLRTQYDGRFPRDYEDAPDVRRVPLGFDRNGKHHDTAKAYAIQPFWYEVNCSLGTFRAFNFKPFTQYVNNKVYDPVFWAPKDDSRPAQVDEYFDDPGEWPIGSPNIYHPTYCISMSAMLDPTVFRASSKGGFQDPIKVDTAFRSPPRRSRATSPAPARRRTPMRRPSSSGTSRRV